MVCLISGNATIVKLRRNDFVKYLKINVASLIGSEYDFVRVTSISYTPQVLVNVSLHWNENTEPKIIKSLGRLALHNDTLLDLSGEHFNLTDFLPASALLSPKALSPLEEGDAAAAAADPRQVSCIKDTNRKIRTTFSIYLWHETWFRKTRYLKTLRLFLLLYH